MRLIKLAASAAVVGLLALSWQAQRETNRRLDALASAVAAKPETPPPAPQPGGGAGHVDRNIAPAAGAIPRELDKAPLPAYVVEAPDVLTIEATARDPKGGTKPLPVQALSGSFLVRPDGMVNLGVWGQVAVAGLTLEQTAAAVRKHFAPDGVAGKVAARAAGTVIGEVDVTVDVVAYNSKAYYVVTDGGDGEQVFRLPCTGGDTVLDAMTQVGAPKAGGKRNVWVARTTADGMPQILPVDWVGITQQGVTQTNYQILPGDRVYVKAGK